MMVVVGMKYIVCFSGGHSSAIAAVEVVRKYGAENTILLNHDLCPRTEDKDIKRFKNEVADYLGVPITYANMPGWETKDQFNPATGHYPSYITQLYIKEQMMHNIIMNNDVKGYRLHQYYETLKEQEESEV